MINLDHHWFIVWLLDNMKMYKIKQIDSTKLKKIKNSLIFGPNRTLNGRLLYEKNNIFVMRWEQLLDKLYQQINKDRFWPKLTLNSPLLQHDIVSFIVWYYQTNTINQSQEDLFLGTNWAPNGNFRANNFFSESRPPSST